MNAVKYTIVNNNQKIPLLGNKKGEVALTAQFNIDPSGNSFAVAKERCGFNPRRSLTDEEHREVREKIVRHVISLVDKKMPVECMEMISAKSKNSKFETWNVTFITGKNYLGKMLDSINKKIVKGIKILDLQPYSRQLMAKVLGLRMNMSAPTLQQQDAKSIAIMEQLVSESKTDEPDEPDEPAEPAEIIWTKRVSNKSPNGWYEESVRSEEADNSSADDDNDERVNAMLKTAMKFVTADRLIELAKRLKKIEEADAEADDE